MVRQYTQLIALMENRDVFRENLQIAAEATGELERQANVYAKSWEAARDRVKAASEDIYDSLINDQFYIDADNTLTGLLSSVADLIDGFGGLKGVAMTAGSIMLQLYGDKLAQSMRDLVVNIGIVSGAQVKAVQRTKIEAFDLANELTSMWGDDTTVRARLESYDRQVQLQNAISDNYDRMNEADKEALANAQQLLTIMEETTAERAEQAELARQEFDISRSNIAQAVRKQDSKTDFKALLNRSDLTDDEIAQIQAENIQKNLKAVGELQTKFNQFAKDSHNIRAIEEYIKSLGQTIDDFGNNAQDLEKLNRQFNILESFDGDELSDAFESVKVAIWEANQDLEEYRRNFQEIINDSDIVDANIKATLNEADTTAVYEQSNQATKEATNEIVEQINQANLSTRDWADTIVTVAQKANDALMVFTAIQNIGSIINDENMTSGEKFVAILGSVTMMLPTAVSLLKSLNLAQKDYTLTVQASSAAEAWEIAQGKVKIGQHVTSAAAVQTETGAIQANTYAVQVNTAAWYANPMTWVVAGITAIVSIIAISNNAIAENTRLLQKNIETAQQQVDTIHQSRTDNEKLIQSYEEALRIYQETGDNKNELNDLTRELSDAYGLENDSLARITGRYEDYVELLAQARKEREKQIQLELTDRENLVTQTREGALDQSRNLRQWWAALAGQNMEGWDWNFGKDYRGIAQKALEDNRVAYLRTLGRGDIATIGLDENSWTNIELVYDVSKQIIENIEQLNDPDALNSDPYKNAVKFMEQFGEAVEKSRNEMLEIKRLRLDIEVDSSTVQTLQDYIDYITALKEKGADDEDIDVLVSRSANNSIKSLQDLYESMDQFAEISGLTRDEIQSLFTTETFDEQVIKNINWALVENEADFRQAYESAEAYSQALKDIDETANQLNSLKELKSALSDGMLNTDELEKLQDVLSDKEFNDLLAMDMSDRAEYAEEAYQKALGAYNEASQALVNTAKVQLNQSSEQLAILRNETNELQNEFNRINQIVNSSDFNKRPSAEQQAILESKNRLESSLELRVTRISIADGAIAGIQSILDNAKLHVKLSIEEQANYALEQANGDFQTLKNLLADGTIEVEAFNHAWSVLQNTLDEDVDTSSHEQLTKTLMREAKTLDILDDGLANNKKAARNLSEEILRFNSAVQTVISNYDEFLEAIESDDIIQNSEALEELRNAYADVLNVSAEGFSNDFISDVNNLNLLRDAVNGVEGAYESLQRALVDDIRAHVSIDTEQFEEGLAAIEQLKLDMEFDDIRIGAQLDDRQFLEGLTRIINMMALTEDQANSLLGAMSIDAELERIPPETIPVEQVMHYWDPPTYDTKTIGGALNAGVSAMMGTAFQALSLVNPGAMIPVSSVSTFLSNPPAFSLRVKNANKAAGGNLKSTSRSAGRGGGGGGGGGGGSAKANVQTGKQPTRYHQVDRSLKRQSEALSNVDNDINRAYGTRRLELFTKQQEELNKQLEYQNQKLKEAEGYLQTDKKALTDLFGTAIQFGKNGEISNYKQIEDSLLKRYNDYVERYNKMSAAEQEAKKEQFDQETEYFEKRMEAIATYEGTLDVWYEMRDAIKETNQALKDSILAQTQHRLEIIIDYKDLQKSFNNFFKTVKESLGDALDFTIPVEKINQANMKLNKDQLTAYQTTMVDLIKQLDDPKNYQNQDEILASIKEIGESAMTAADELWSWIMTFKELIPNALDAALERFSRFTNQLEHNNAIMDATRQLMQLQGVTNKTAKGFESLQKVTQNQYDSYVAQSVLNKQYNEHAKDLVEKAKQDIDTLENQYAMGQMTETNYQIQKDILQRELEAALQQMNDTEQAMLENAANAMEAAKQMMLDAVEHFGYEMEQELTNNLGFDLLQDKFDHYLEKEEFYFDKVNEAYQTATWFNKLQADIDQSTNKSHIDRLKALQDEIEVRRKNNTLSQYDLDILEAKYKVLQAQAALEDAQNNKNQMRLVRDRQGNWNYQYTADPDQIADAEKNLADAEIDWYNIAKERRKDMMSEIIDNQRELNEALVALDQEYVENGWEKDEQYYARKSEIENYYLDKDKRLREEYQIAVEDMTEAGNWNLFHLAADQGDRITDLTGITSDELKNIASELGTDVKSLVGKDLNEIASLVDKDGTAVINAYKDVYLQDIQDIITSSGGLEQAVVKYNTSMEESWTKYGNNLTNVSDKCGVSLDELGQRIEDVAQANEYLYQAGEQTVDTVWRQVDAIVAQTDAYRNATQALLEYLDALMQLANTAIEEVGGHSGIEFDANLDYAKLIRYVMDHADEYRAQGIDPDQLVAQLNAERNAKIQHGKEHGFYYGEQDYYNVEGEDWLKDEWANAGSLLAGATAADLEKYKQQIEERRKMAAMNQSSHLGGYRDIPQLNLALPNILTNEVVNAPRPLNVSTRDITSAANISSEMYMNQMSKLADSNWSIAKSLENLILEQDVHIEVSLPGVDSVEKIELALTNLINDAAQWATSSARV